MVLRLALHALAATAVGFSTGAVTGRELAQDSAPAYRLEFVDEGPSAKLAYGVPDSDALALMLECDKGSGRVAISDALRQGPPRLVLAAGSARTALAVQTEDMAGSTVMTAETSARAPALTAFRRAGALDVTSGETRYRVAADRAQRREVDRFFAACERA